MLSKDRKHYLVNNELFNIYCNFVNVEYLKFNQHIIPQILIPYFNGFDIDKFLSIEEKKDCERLFNSRRSKASRVRKYLTCMCSKPTLFLTLTFTDSVLDSTCAKTRRVYVTRFLRSLAVPCIANIDFGDLNEREHYHALVQLDFIDLDSWSYGGMHAEHVRNCEGSLKAVSKYITKFVNHCIKDSTDVNSNLIYIKMKDLYKLPLGCSLFTYTDINIDDIF